jgi:hypothetical protein
MVRQAHHERLGLTMNEIRQASFENHRTGSTNSNYSLPFSLSPDVSGKGL